MRNLYDVLEISPNASNEVIKSAYRALAKKYHPDLGISSLNESMAELNHAYEVLSDPEKRREYDRSINKNFNNSTRAADIFAGLNPKEFFTVIDLKCKLIPIGYTLTNINDNEVLAKVNIKNYYSNPVIAIKGEIRCFDYFGKEYKFNGKPFQFFLQDIYIKPLFSSSDYETISVLINESPNIKLIFVEIKEMVFENGDQWRQNAPLWVNTNNTTRLINNDERLKLKHIFSIDNPWKPFKTDEYWGCVCGKHNLISDTVCIKCKRKLDETVLTSEDIDKRHDEFVKKATAANKKRNRRNLAILVPIALIIVVWVIWLIMPVDKEKIYASAKEYSAENKNYEAFVTYGKIPDYLDSLIMRNELIPKIYEDALREYGAKNYSVAQRYLKAVEGYQGTAALMALCEHYSLESTYYNIFADSVKEIETKRALLATLSQYSNSNGDYLEKECFIAASSLFYVDTKLFANWYNEGVGFFGLSGSESNGDLMFSNNFKRVSDGKYYKMEIVETDGVPYVEIQYGDQDFISSVRILGFNPSDSVSPSELYIYNFADGGNYTLKLNDTI
jgi:curved DNA-binding protein CbpA